MTRLLFILCFISFSFAAQSQRVAKFWWFDTGVKFGYGVSSLYNSAVWNSEADPNDASKEFYDYDVATGYNFGVKMGINKGTSGFTVDGMFSNMKASFERKVPAGVLNNHNVEWNSFDIYTMYRNNRQLGYVELGPKFSFIRDVLDGDPTEALEPSAKDYATNNIAAVLGFGAYFIGSDNRFSGILGLRFEYGVTDFVSATGRGAGAPVPDTSLTNPGVNTSPIFAGIVFELNWGLGYYGKASCGSRAKFINF